MDATVLIIDPSAATRAMYRDYLLHHGFSVCEAATTAEGLSLALDTRPDVIVTELLFPEEDGLAAIRALRHIQANESVILVCSTDISSIWPFAPLGAGVDSALQKPVSPKAMLTEVKHLRARRKVA